MNEELRKEFAEVIAEQGEGLFLLVWNAGMAGEAIAVLTQAAQKHSSRHSLQAVVVVAQAFNEIAEALRSQGGWTREQLEACDAAIKRAFAARIEVPKSVIVLH